MLKTVLGICKIQAVLVESLFVFLGIPVEVHGEIYHNKDDKRHPCC